MSDPLVSRYPPPTTAIDLSVILYSYAVILNDFGAMLYYPRALLSRLTTGVLTTQTHCRHPLDSSALIPFQHIRDKICTI